MSPDEKTDVRVKIKEDNSFMNYDSRVTEIVQIKSYRIKIIKLWVRKSILLAQL